jgi:hypothetical protein
LELVVCIRALPHTDHLAIMRPDIAMERQLRTSWTGFCGGRELCGAVNKEGLDDGQNQHDARHHQFH